MVQPFILPLLLLSRQNPQKIPAGWIVQKFDHDSFQVMAPVRLVLSKKPQSDSSMKTVNTWVGATPDASYVFSLGELKVPGRTHLSALLTGSVAGYIDDSDTSVDGIRDILIHGWPGIALTVTGKDGLTLTAHIVRVEDKALSLISVYRAGTTRPTSVDTFLDSLQISPIGPQISLGPELSRFPLGNTGLTALFPREPNRRESKVGRGSQAGTMVVFTSDYAARSYVAGYRDMPTGLIPTGDERAEAMAEKYIVEDILRSLGGTAFKQSTERIGSGNGLLTQFTAGNLMAGTILVYVDGTRMMSLMTVGAKAYVDPKTVDRFLHSVEKGK